MSVCPTVSVLRFYGCCHPCLGVSGSNNVFPVRMTIPEQTTNRLPVGANQLLDEVDDGM